MNTQIKNIDEYISSFPAKTREKLEEMRAIIQKAAPKATEAIKYAMPTFVMGGNLVHFAGYKNHIGFYPTPSAIVAFKDELSAYETSKGAIQFPLDKKLPLPLVSKMVKFRVKEAEEKMHSKKK